ncbi:MAG: nucleoid occlusion factor SlmA [Psychrobium sp.]|nr:nucleoid occlusion factor SlmA [Psychrobium sp.]
MAVTKKSNRREHILQSLAHMLQTPGNRITTAKLAAQVGVSEAALYRHFPSKARMFEGLIEFIEQSILSRVNIITTEEKNTLLRCYHIIQLLLLFSEKNPGITRILTGDALLGEHDRLRERMSQLFDKIETHLKQILRERKLREGKSFDIDEGALANMLLAYAEGRINQYVRSGFKVKPTKDFELQWSQFAKLLD